MTIIERQKVAYEKGIEKIPAATDTTKVQEALVQAIYNDWLKHQVTRDLVHKLHEHKMNILSDATKLSAKHENINQVTNLLNSVRGLDIVLNIINNYGELNKPN